MTDGSVVRITCSFANCHWGNHRQVFMGTEATFDSGWIGKDEPKFRYAGGDFTIPDNLPLGTNFPDAPETAALGGHGTAEWYMLEDFFTAIRTGGPCPSTSTKAICIAWRVFARRNQPLTAAGR